MIELIFVIVIIGILASVAIPRLSATRDDAVDAKDCKNIAMCVTDLASEYTAKLTATTSDSYACTRALASSRNTISFAVATDRVTVSGAPARCSHLNRTFIYGGGRVSF